MILVIISQSLFFQLFQEWLKNCTEMYSGIFLIYFQHIRVASKNVRTLLAYLSSFIKHLTLPKSKEDLNIYNG